MRNAPNPPPLTVVGVVDDVFDVSVTQPPEPTLYLPWAQNNNSGVPVAFVIRTAVDPASLLPAVREVVRGIDASLPLRRVQPLEVFVRESTAPERFRTMVLGIIAMLGLVLAAVGISGVTYRGVVDRTREFAVRLALGSQPAAVVRLVLLESMRDLAIGAVAGLAGGIALCMLLARSLENVGAVDAITTGVVDRPDRRRRHRRGVPAGAARHARAAGRSVTKLGAGAGAPTFFAAGPCLISRRMNSSMNGVGGDVAERGGVPLPEDAGPGDADGPDVAGRDHVDDRPPGQHARRPCRP